MTRRNARAVALAVLVAAVVLVAFTAERPDFSGVWLINPFKSRLANWARFDSTTITIEHKEPKFHFHRLSAKAGKTDETGYDLTTDGVEVVEKEGGASRTSKLVWEGEALVYYSRMVLANGREATDVVRYTLRDGGQTFVAEEMFRGPVLKYDNLWVADRKSSK